MCLSRVYLELHECPADLIDNSDFTSCSCSINNDGCGAGAEGLIQSGVQFVKEIFVRVIRSKEIRFWIVQGWQLRTAIPEKGVFSSQTGYLVPSAVHVD